MKKSLSDIAEGFNGDLKDNGFFLSNIASKSSALPKMINTLLIATTLMGSMSGLASAHEPVNRISEDNMYSVVQHNGDNSTQIIGNSIVKHLETAKELTAETIKDIGQGESGVFKLPDGKIAFIFNVNDIQIESPQERLNLQGALHQEDSGFMNFKGSGASTTSVVHNGETLKYGLVKVGFDDYTSHIENFAEKYPTIAKHEKTLIAAHELSHATKHMQTVTNLMQDENLGQSEKILINESFADISSLGLLAKAEKLSPQEVLSLATELSQLRQDGANKLDSHHGTFYAINHFITAFENNQVALKDLISSDMNSIVAFSASLAHDATIDLALNTEYKLTKTIRVSDFERDTAAYIENGGHSSDSMVSGIQHGLLKSKYEETVEMLAEKQIETGSFKAAMKGKRGMVKAIAAVGWHATALKESLFDYHPTPETSNEMVNTAMRQISSRSHDSEIVQNHGYSM